MKAELNLPQELVDQLTDQIIDRLKPMLSGNGKHEDNTVFDKEGLAKYLNTSISTINKLVADNQIPFFKLSNGQSGGVRFNQRDVDRWIAKRTVPESNIFRRKL